jgi:hypothetical protein
LLIFLGNEAGKFTLDSATGILLLNSTLDYETAPSYTIIIHAHDTNTAGITRFVPFTVHVTVIDVNDNTPTFSQPQYFLIVNEDSPPGFVVSTLSAVDPDGGVNGLVTYSIIWSNNSYLWNINSSTGALTLNGKILSIFICTCKLNDIYKIIMFLETDYLNNAKWFTEL